jgi:hypothetical protein
MSHNYNFNLGDHTYDLSAAEPINLEGMTGAELVETYNRMCKVAASIKHFDTNGRKTQPVKKFKDRDTATKRIAALHSSLVAFASGQRALENHAEAPLKAAKAPKEKKAKEPKAPKEPTHGHRGRAPTFHLKTIHMGEKLLQARAKRFADYREGMTVGEYVAAAVARSMAEGRKTKTGAREEHEALAIGDIRYDASRGVISLGDPT